MYLFLDIDGVFNVCGTEGVFDHCRVNFENFLEKIPSQILENLKIVITSSWRIDKKEVLLSLLGEKITQYIKDYTPILDKNYVPGNRSLEICDFLKDKFPDKYIIVDDMPSWFNQTHLNTLRLYIVDNHVGFTANDVEQLLKRIVS